MSVRFKYYLRGCGVGIIVASFIFIVTLHAKGGVMTDEKAMARASELGMVMSEESQTGESQTVVTQTQTTQIPVTESNTPDTQKTTQKETQTQSSKVNQMETESETKDSKKTQKSDTENPKSSQKTESTEKSDTKKDVKKEDSAKKDKDKKQEETQNSEAPEEVSITIRGGEVCRQIAQKLQDKGLVKDAEEFRKYMQEHDYAKYIRVGTFTLKKGMSYSEIAQVLTKR